MKSVGQLVLGLLAAVGTGLLIIAAISLSLVEGGQPVAVVPVQPSPTEQIQPLTPAPELTQPATQNRPLVQTATPTQPVLCPAPANWEPYQVQAGDTLERLAQGRNQSADQILQANCLLSPSLLPGTILYLPRTEATRTHTPAGPTPVPCGPPYGWVRYTVQPNDTLFRLSQAFGVSVARLQLANCMSGTLIQAGSRLYVPNVPTRTPPVTNTPAATQTPAVTDTPAQPPQATNTPVVPATATPVTPTQATPTEVTPTVTDSVPTDISPTPAVSETSEPVEPTITVTPEPTADGETTPQSAARDEPERSSTPG